MKKYIIFSFVAIFAAIISFTSCGKETVEFKEKHSNHYSSERDLCHHHKVLVNVSVSGTIVTEQYKWVKCCAIHNGGGYTGDFLFTLSEVNDSTAVGINNTNVVFYQNNMPVDTIVSSEEGTIDLNLIPDGTYIIRGFKDNQTTNEIEFTFPVTGEGRPALWFE